MSRVAGCFSVKRFVKLTHCYPVSWIFFLVDEFCTSVRDVTDKGKGAHEYVELHILSKRARADMNSTCD